MLLLQNYTSSTKHGPWKNIDGEDGQELGQEVQTELG